MNKIKSCADCKPADIDCQISVECKRDMKRRKEMETVATCKCGCQSWSIKEHKITCSKCGKEYHFCKDMPANVLINLVNDNY